MLTSNEEMSKIEKTYLQKHRQVVLVLDKPVFDKGLFLPINLYLFRKHMCQMPGGHPGVC